MSDFKIIPLTKGYEAIVDAEDYEYINQWTWRTVITLYGHKYAQNSHGKYIHRLVMKAKGGEYIDHKNHDTLDNRKCNLRLCTSAENGRNSIKTPSKTSSIFKGVHFRKNRGTWIARIKLLNERLFLGSYKTQEDAAKAYNEAAKKHFGEFALLNEVAI